MAWRQASRRTQRPTGMIRPDAVGLHGRLSLYVLSSRSRTLAQFLTLHSREYTSACVAHLQFEQ